MMKPPIPILRSFDEAKAKEFYIDFLEFEVVFEHRYEANFPLYMGIRRGDCVIHVSEHHGDGCPGSALRISMGGLDDYVGRLRAKKYKNSRPGKPVLQPWGSREITISDPFGNRLTFVEKVEASEGEA